MSKNTRCFKEEGKEGITVASRQLRFYLKKNKHWKDHGVGESHFLLVQTIPHLHGHGITSMCCEEKSAPGEQLDQLELKVW